jgi:peptide alpha-N-acetyltransferase
VPPLFKELKNLFKNPAKSKIIEELVLDYIKNLEASNKFDNNAETETETPTTVLWSYYFMAQFYDLKNITERALFFINKALEHTPTLIELYIVKGKILKHCGNTYEAVKCLDEAQSLDTADRYLNYKCSKYLLRANLVKESQEMAGKFTRVNFFFKTL